MSKTLNKDKGFSNRDDKILSTPTITESIGSSSSANLTSESGLGYDGLAGNTPLLPNYNRSDNPLNSDKNNFFKAERD